MRAWSLLFFCLLFCALGCDNNVGNDPSNNSNNNSDFRQPDSYSETNVNNGNDVDSDWNPGDVPFDGTWNDTDYPDGTLPDGTGQPDGTSPPDVQEELPPPEWCNPAWTEECDNLDNDCDGVVDEGCTCDTPEKVCYSGPPWTMNIGQCRSGMQSCYREFYEEECRGEVLPSGEVCDGVDNDCNGQTDEIEDCANEPPIVECPPDQVSAPLSTVTLTGSASDPEGGPLTYLWEVISAPPGSSSSPSQPNSATTQFFLDMAGEYILRFTAFDQDGGQSSCQVTITAIPTERLRVELVWNVGISGDTSDVDLHLKHQSGFDWFSSAYDCFFYNCNSSSGHNLEWGGWGDDDNPRLDLDDVEGNGPENINIDLPQTNVTYTVGVHYWDNDEESSPATAWIKVYCNMQLAGEFGPQSIMADGANRNSNDFWLVAEVVYNADNTCTIRRLGNVVDKGTLSDF